MLGRGASAETVVGLVWAVGCGVMVLAAFGLDFEGPAASTLRWIAFVVLVAAAGSLGAVQLSLGESR